MNKKYSRVIGNGKPKICGLRHLLGDARRLRRQAKKLAQRQIPSRMVLKRNARLLAKSIDGLCAVFAHSALDHTNANKTSKMFWCEVSELFTISKKLECAVSPKCSTRRAKNGS